MKNPIVPINNPDIDEAKFAGAMDETRKLATEDVFAIGIDIGRLEAMDFVATVTTSAMLSIYENVKKSKGWQFLRNPKSGHGDHFQSLEEFCEVKLGKSYTRLRHLVANRNAVGQDAFEQAEKLGLRQKDYNAIKALPAQDKELVRRAVEDAKSRDEVLDLLQELAVRHVAEKQKLSEELQETRNEKAAVEQRLEVVRKQREDAEADTAAAKAEAKIIKTAPAEEFIERLQKEASAAVGEALGAVRWRMREALVAIQQAPDHPAKEVLMAALVGQVQAELNALRNEFNLPDVSSAADQALAAEVAEWAK